MGVITNPSHATDNVIQATADVPDLTLRPFSDAQTNPVLRVQNAAGTVTSTQILPDGTITSPGAGAGSERFGLGSLASGQNATAVGPAADAGGLDSVAIGGGSKTVLQASVSIGLGAVCDTNINGTAIGALAHSGGANSVTMGVSSDANGMASVCIGLLANDSGHANSVCIGNGAAINTGGSGAAGIAVGAQAFPDNSSLSIGAGAPVGGSINLAPGITSNPGAFGPAVFSVGSGAFPCNHVFLGNGALPVASPAAVDIQPTSALGTNIAGANMALAGGKSTGNAKGGDVLIQTSPAGGAGSTLNALTTIAQFTGDNKIGLFGAAPVVRQVGASAAGLAAIVDPNAKAALTALQTALANLGLVTSPA